MAGKYHENVESAFASTTSKNKLSMDDNEPLGGGAARAGGSLSARYLSQPQRLVGCSLPPLVADAGVTTGTRGFVTFAVPHILESAATTQSLPETSLVRFRWKDEASQRGSLFQPVKITNAPGLLLHRRRTATPRHERETAAGAQVADRSRDNGAEAEEETKSHATNARSIEMVYPVCVDAKRFVEYLRDMNELVLDVIDRSTRRRYGKCVIPLFASSAASSDGNAQERTVAAEHELRQLRCDNALYEIKSLDSDQDDDMIGYLAIKLDIQFRDIVGENPAHPIRASSPSRSTVPLASRPAPVLVPRPGSTVHVNVRQNRQTWYCERDDEHRFQFGDLSPISYLESDAFHTLQGSSPGSESLMSSMSSVLRERTDGGSDLPLQSSKLQHLIEKGKALQKSMAEAAEEEEGDWRNHQYPVVTSASAHINGIHEIVSAATNEDSSDDVSDHDPRSWQSILKQAQRPSEEVEPRTVHGNPMTSGTALRLPSVNDRQGLKIGFEAVKFTSGFIDQLQQLRDSAISSRFSPIDMAVSHTDVGALLASTTENGTPNQVERHEPLFTITPSLRKRAFRLTFSHVAPLHVRGDFSTLSFQLRSTKKQLHFYVTCRTQGTPRRHQQGSRYDKKNQILLRGAVPVRDILFDREASSDLQAVSVSLFIHQEDGTTAQRTRRPEKAHRVGVMKVTFQPCTIKAENSKPEINGESHLIYASHASSHEWTSQRAKNPSPIRELESKKTRKRMNTSRRDTSKSPVPAPMITTQLAVMIDKVSSICSFEARLRRVPFEESVLRFQYAIPPSSSASNIAPPIGSFKRSFRRKLIRGAQGRACEFCANVGHIGVFPLDVNQLVARDFKKRLLIIEVWLQGQQLAKDDEGELLGLVKISFTAFSSCFRKNSSDWEQAVPFVGVDGQFPIEDPFSGQFFGFLQIRIAVGTAEQIIALNLTVRAITRLQAIIRGVLSRKANLTHYRSISSGSVDANPIRHPASSPLSDNGGELEQGNHSEDAEVTPNGESLENLRGSVDNDAENHTIQPSKQTQDEEHNPSISMKTASFLTTRQLLPANISVSIQVLSISDLMHAIEEKWSQVCASASELELKKHLEGLLTDGVVTAILECDFCLGVEIEETTEARSMERDGATSRLYKKSGRWYKHLRFPATQCAVMNSKQLLQMRSPLRVQVVVHPEVIQIIQDECLNIRILSWCPRSNCEYHIGTTSVPIAAMLFRPSGVQGAFSIAIGDVLSGRLGVQVQIDRQPGALTFDHVLPVLIFGDRRQERTSAKPVNDRPPSRTSPDEVATDPSSANHDDYPQFTQVREEDYQNLHSEGNEYDDPDALRSSEKEHHDGLDRRETEPIAFNLDQHSDFGGNLLAAQSAESVESGAEDSYPSWQVIGDAEKLAADKERSSDDHFRIEERGSVIGQGDSQADDFRPPSLNDTTDYYEPITLASFGIEEFELSPLSDSLSPSARSPDPEQYLSQNARFDEPETLFQQVNHQFATVESPATRQIPPLTTDDLEEYIVNDLTSAAVAPQQAEISRGQDADVGDSHTDAEEAAAGEKEPGEIPQSSDHNELEELGTAGSAPFVSVDGEHDVLQDSCTLTELPNDETRSLGSDYVDHGTDSSAEDHTDVPVEAAFSSLAVVDPGDIDFIATDSTEICTVGADNELGSSASQCESREDPAETIAIVSEEKGTQVNVEICDVMEGSTQNCVKEATEDLERVNFGVDQATHAKSESVEHAEQEAPVHGKSLQPEHFTDRVAGKEMIDAACGTTDDDFDCIAEFESSHGSDVEHSLHGEAHGEDLEVKEETLEISTTPSGTDADDKVTLPSSDDSSCASAEGPPLPQQEQVPSPQSPFSLSADKFELICQLLTEIRDSCGPGLVKEILLAHNNSRVAQNSSQTELISAEPHPTTSTEVQATAQARHSKADTELDNLTDFAAVKRQEEISSSQIFRQSSSPRSAAEPEKATFDVHGDADHQYRDRVDTPESPRLPPVRGLKGDLKAVHWSDSFTLQQEMQRRMKTCDADQFLRERTEERKTKARTSSRHDVKLFGGEVEALPSTLFEFSTRQSKKPFQYKADSETERIARIMQGSVNYWRKGDEDALTSDDDSVDSCDSDDDDWCF